MVSSFEGATGLNANSDLIVCDSKENFEAAIHHSSQGDSTHYENSLPLVSDQRQLLRQKILDALIN